MKYTYAYKTPDGVRHEDSMDAPSREEVFVALRRAGIRAIKVVAADGSKANGEVRGVRMRIVAAVSAAAAVLAGAGVYFLASDRGPAERGGEEAPPEIVFTTEESRVAFTNLEAQASRILRRHSASMKALDLDVLGDYQFIADAGETAALDRKVREGYRAVDSFRAEVRDLFKSIFAIFPEDCRVEREEAQRLYAETMDKLEVSERRIVKDEKALRLLVGNRGKWRCVGGKVVWSDATLSNEFEYFRREPSSTPRNGGYIMESQQVKSPAKE